MSDYHSRIETLRLNLLRNRMQSTADNPKRGSGILQGLKKTKSGFFDKLTALVGGRGKIDPATLAELEDTLIMADVGIDSSIAIVSAAKAVAKSKPSDGDALVSAIRAALLNILKDSEKRIVVDDSNLPHVILMVGVNGVGKTTTAAKIAHHFQSQGYPAMMAACDTFRAAAVEQLQLWGECASIPVIAHRSGSDPAAVAHDAMHAAIARNASVLVLDTAGRQHSRDDLMRQIEKISRVVAKIEPSAPHSTLIAIDAATGQNAISQVETFSKHVPLTGICISKLDGTAKGGIVVALSQRFALPISYIGFGEKINDIDEFHAATFVDSLLSKDAMQ